MTGLLDAIRILESNVEDARKGLPEDVFRLLTRLTPMVNVDLLIQDPAGRTLLTWRADGHFAPGWHVPGGIIRFKEHSSARIKAVAELELGAQVAFDPEPIALNELIFPGWETRSHFISMLFRCRLTSPLDPARAYDGRTLRPGVWAWHETCPQDLMAVHEVYRPYLEGAMGSASTAEPARAPAGSPAVPVQGSS